MKVLITGATGLIGQKLSRKLLARGHSLVVLTRSLKGLKQKFPFPCEAYEWDEYSSQLLPEKVFSGVDGVIHLAGENVGGGRWTVERKKRILESRTKSSALLLQSLKQSSHKPKVLISASAIGIYGNALDHELNESSPTGEGFLAEVCRQWEGAVQTHLPHGIRHLTIRIGLVLAREGGVLSQLVNLSRWGQGGAVGSGQQWMSWVHIDDVVNLFVQGLENSAWQGVVNAVSPETHRQQDFMKILSQHLKTFYPPIKAPAQVLKLVLGEMSQLVLDSQKVVSQQTATLGYRFAFAELKQALEDLYPQVHLKDCLLKKQQWVPASVDKVFEFHSRAENLGVITPPWLNFKILSQSTENMQQGTLIDYQISLHGLPMRWKTEITQWNPPQSFMDVQLKGPYSKWEHLHSFTAMAGGTLLEDRVYYKMPMGKLGLLALPIVMRDVQKIFAFRQKKISEIFGD